MNGWLIFVELVFFLKKKEEINFPNTKKRNGQRIVNYGIIFVYYTVVLNDQMIPILLARESASLSADNLM